MSLTPVSPLKLKSWFLLAYFCSFVVLLINVVNIMTSLRCLGCHRTFYKYKVECNTGAICLCNEPWTDSQFKIKTNVSSVWQHSPAAAITLSVFFMGRSDMLAQNCSLWFPNWFLKELPSGAACRAAPSTAGSFPGHPWCRYHGCKEKVFTNILQEQRVAVGLAGV